MRRELHIPKSIQEWRACEHDFDWHIDLQPEGSFWIYPLLKANGYKVLVYSGDTDGAVPTYGTQRWINELNWPIKKDWSPWYSNEGSKEDQLQIQGFKIEYEGLTFMTIHGVGHMAPAWRKKEVL